MKTVLLRQDLSNWVLPAFCAENVLISLVGIVHCAGFETSQHSVPNILCTHILCPTSCAQHFVPIFCAPTFSAPIFFAPTFCAHRPFSISFVLAQPTSLVPQYITFWHPRQRTTTPRALTPCGLLCFCRMLSGYCRQNLSGILLCFVKLLSP